MSESAQHAQLVQIIINHVQQTLGDNSILLLTDKADNHGLPPMMEEGFRPDVFYEFSHQLIIGEAKTSNDVDRDHSRYQYESYIKKCQLFDGEASLVIAVPWTEHITVANILKRIQRKYPGNYNITILDGIGGAI
ncbi:MAG: hypothetical protein IJH64_01300 [Oscillospiraceae bacterium]|nr:hypothetical protein [Oscillospiraceae bacterium]